ncbi:hypothetical protein RSOLAG1IB_10275 [Rhizoctonia solani AG-1 IB]|uniref:Uncharacterized protein n=1 Tax=Thanatephorus cucumeris (strain AG1-IB / isolate 7/3/14) TaxID=1108050 RepID=A0A0B7G124_THACB|nr:hypothetical protein RSOLAG1IB_10275 [Rhizoctonia solani AG-1 IB]
MFIFGDSYSTASWAPTIAPNPNACKPYSYRCGMAGVTSVGAFQPNWVLASTILLRPDIAIEPTISQIMQQQQNLYNLGARNFIFVNVPPWDWYPLGTTFPGLKERILTWNGQLTTSALAFSNQNTDASTLVFSSWDTFNTLLNDPSHYNLTSPTTIGGDIWKDDLHQTSAVHYRIANDLAGWLASLPAGASSPTTTSASTTTSAPATSASTIRPAVTITVGVFVLLSVLCSYPNMALNRFSYSARQRNLSWTYVGLAVGLAACIFL